MIDVAADTVPVTFTVLGIEHLRGCGRLLAIAEIAVEIAGVEFAIRGVRIVREGAGLAVEAPVFSHRGLPRAAIDLPDVLSSAMADELLVVYREPEPVPWR